jgi:SAM-dependent methyltransferase
VKPLAEEGRRPVDPRDQASILKFHQTLIAQHGNGTAGAQGWETSRDQEIRFEILCRIGDLNGASVLDAGCGCGDFRGYLHRTFPGAAYTGIDHLADFLDVAVDRYGGWPQTRFLLGDLATARLEPHDYVLVSGALNYRNRTPGHLFRMVDRLWGICRRGLAFNLLGHVRNPEGLLAAYEPEAVLAYGRTLDPDAVLQQGYLDREFTVFLRRREVLGFQVR